LPLLLEIAKPSQSDVEKRSDEIIRGAATVSAMARA